MFPLVNIVPEVQLTLVAPEHVGTLLTLELFGSGLADVGDSAVDVDRRCLFATECLDAQRMRPGDTWKIWIPSKPEASKS